MADVPYKLSDFQPQTGYETDIFGNPRNFGGRAFGSTGGWAFDDSTPAGRAKMDFAGKNTEIYNHLKAQGYTDAEIFGGAAQASDNQYQKNLNEYDSAQVAIPGSETDNARLAELAKMKSAEAKQGGSSSDISGVTDPYSKLIAQGKSPEQARTALVSQQSDFNSAQERGFTGSFSQFAKEVPIENYFGVESKSQQESAMISKMYAKNTASADVLIKSLSSVLAGERPLPPGMSAKDVERALDTLQSAKAEYDKPQVFNESNAERILGQKIISRGYDQAGNFTDVSFKKGNRTYTVDIFGNILAVQSSSSLLDMPTGNLTSKSSGALLNSRTVSGNAELNDLLKGTGISLIAPRETQAFSDWFAPQFQQQAKGMGAEAFAMGAVGILGSTLGGGRSADMLQFVSYNKLASGDFEVFVNPGIDAGMQAKVGEVLGKYLAGNYGQYPYATYVKESPSKFLIKNNFARLAENPSYAFSSEFGSSYNGAKIETTSFEEKPFMADIILDLGEKNVRYSEMTPTQRSAVNEFVLPQLQSKVNYDLLPLLSKTPADLAQRRYDLEEGIMRDLRMQLLEKGATNIAVVKHTDTSGIVSFEAVGNMPPVSSGSIATQSGTGSQASFLFGLVKTSGTQYTDIYAGIQGFTNEENRSITLGNYSAFKQNLFSQEDSNVTMPGATSPGQHGFFDSRFTYDVAKAVLDFIPLQITQSATGAFEYGEATWRGGEIRYGFKQPSDYGFKTTDAAFAQLQKQSFEGAIGIFSTPAEIEILEAGRIVIGAGLKISSKILGSSVESTALGREITNLLPKTEVFSNLGKVATSAPAFYGTVGTISVAASGKDLKTSVGIGLATAGVIAVSPVVSENIANTLKSFGKAGEQLSTLFMRTEYSSDATKIAETVRARELGKISDKEFKALQVSSSERKAAEAAGINVQGANMENVKAELAKMQGVNIFGKQDEAIASFQRQQAARTPIEKQIAAYFGAKYEAGSNFGFNAVGGITELGAKVTVKGASSAAEALGMKESLQTAGRFGVYKFESGSNMVRDVALENAGRAAFTLEAIMARKTPESFALDLQMRSDFADLSSFALENAPRSKSPKAIRIKELADWKVSLEKNTMKSQQIEADRSMGRAVEFTKAQDILAEKNTKTSKQIDFEAHQIEADISLGEKIGYLKTEDILSMRNAKTSRQINFEAHQIEADVALGTKIKFMKAGDLRPGKTSAEINFESLSIEAERSLGKKVEFTKAGDLLAGKTEAAAAKIRIEQGIESFKSSPTRKLIADLEAAPKSDKMATTNAAFEVLAKRKLADIMNPKAGAETPKWELELSKRKLADIMNPKAGAETPKWELELSKRKLADIMAGKGKRSTAPWEINLYKKNLADIVSGKAKEKNALAGKMILLKKNIATELRIIPASSPIQITAKPTITKPSSISISKNLTGVQAIQAFSIKTGVKFTPKQEMLSIQKAVQRSDLRLMEKTSSKLENKLTSKQESKLDTRLTEKLVSKYETKLTQKTTQKLTQKLNQKLTQKLTQKMVLRLEQKQYTLLPPLLRSRGKRGESKKKRKGSGFGMPRAVRGLAPDLFSVAGSKIHFGSATAPNFAKYKGLYNYSGGLVPTAEFLRAAGK